MGDKLPGLTDSAAKSLLVTHGPNKLEVYRVSVLRILLRQFNNSLIYLLIFAAVISLFLSSVTDVITIVTILLVNAVMGFIQEYRSEKFIEKLHLLIRKYSLVRRSNHEIQVMQEDLVPGDIVILEEGAVVPADGKVTYVESALVDDALVTGESLPVSKATGDDLFSGTTINHGYIEMEIISTGGQTQLGKIAKLSTMTRKKSEYEENITRMSSLLMRITLALLFIIFIANIVTRGASYTNFINILLFTTALAISVVPEALPVISTMTLSLGALKLAAKQVVVKRLSAIEDLGNIEVLCTDKTGTLTQNLLTMQDVVSSTPRKLARLVYPCLENGNAIDDAIRAGISKHIAKMNIREPLQYVPFDAKLRKRYAVVEYEGDNYLVVMGAAEETLAAVEDREKELLLAKIRKEANGGLRHIVVAAKKVGKSFSLEGKINESGLDYLGYFTLFDPVRTTAVSTINLAKKLGVSVKIISGDSLEVANFTARSVGLIYPGEEAIKSFTGTELEKLPDREYPRAVREGVVFARVSPEQKFKIIETLKKEYVIGYQGDGINDAPALKAAHVGIAVSGAADVAAEAADIICFHKDLKVIIEGIEDGRKIFFNIDKYIKHTMVSNWGNFFAVAIISVFTDFLPLLPIQLLLTSLLSDLPLLTIATDNVDRDDLLQPAKYKISDLIALPVLLGGFTMIFNLVFYYYVRTMPLGVMRTLWFLIINSMSLVVIFSVRRRGFMLSGKLPGLTLTLSVFGTIIFSLILPFVPFSGTFHFTRIDSMGLSMVIIGTIVYIFVLDIIKVIYYRESARPKWSTD